MSVASNETPAATPEKSGFTLLELFLAMMVVSLFIAMVGTSIMSTDKMEDIERIIRADAFGAGKTVESCSILINTQRHEGKCGTFGKYKVLTGGREIYVYDGPAEEPRIVGGLNMIGGFVAEQELQDFALKN